MSRLDEGRWMIGKLAIRALVAGLVAWPIAAAANQPDLVGNWSCDPSPILIRGAWTTLTYTFEVTEQRDALFSATFHWSLPSEQGVEGNQEGTDAFSGTVETFGMVDWEGTGVEIVAYKDTHRHDGTLVDPDTIRFTHSETGNDAWVSRSVCRRVT